MIMPPDLSYGEAGVQNQPETRDADKYRHNYALIEF
jgi:hypothetical protein